LLFEQTGSYDVVWWLSVFFGVASPLVNPPIVRSRWSGPWRGPRHVP
jgi:hypothetical protein